MRANRILISCTLISILSGCLSNIHFCYSPGPPLAPWVIHDVKVAGAPSSSDEINAEYQFIPVQLVSEPNAPNENIFIERAMDSMLGHITSPTRDLHKSLVFNTVALDLAIGVRIVPIGSWESLVLYIHNKTESNLIVNGVWLEVNTFDEDTQEAKLALLPSVLPSIWVDPSTTHRDGKFRFYAYTTLEEKELIVNPGEEILYEHGFSDAHGTAVLAVRLSCDEMPGTIIAYFDCEIPNWKAE